MKATILALILALCFGALVFWRLAWRHRSSDATAFSTSAGSGAEGDAYVSAAAGALDQYLLSQGYGPAVPVSSPFPGVPPGAERILEYRSSPHAPEPVIVVVTLNTGNQGTSSRLNAHVYWEFVGFQWAARRHEALADAALPPIRAWWETYQEKHARR